MTVTHILNKTIGDRNVGSIDQVLFIPVDYLTGLARTGLININPIVAPESDNGGWRVAEFVRETAIYTEEGAQGPNGPYVKVKVAFTVAKHYATRVAEMMELREREFAVAVFDSNGVGRLIAEINFRGERKGMTFHEENTTGKAFSERNQYDCYFYCECRNKPRMAYYATRILVEESGGPID